jgi:small subunit ribosomal protein S17
MEQPNVDTAPNAPVEAVTPNASVEAATPRASVEAATPSAAVGPGAAAGGRHRRRIKLGRVASDKMDKTIVVVTETRVPHPVYKKIVRKSVRFKAHDERNEAKAGDTVRIAECRAMSRDKRWRLVEIVERAK